MERETALPEAQLEVMEVIWDRGGSVMFADLSSELEARGKESVSYTHLDVYKRQVEELKKMNNLREDTIHTGQYLTVVYFAEE